MKKIFTLLSILISAYSSQATIHIVKVWDGYLQFVSEADFSSDITIQLGDTVQWLPLDVPSMNHTITSTNIPVGAASFDYLWKAPADTFFQYIPQIAGLYEYECTPHAITYGMVGTITVLNSTAINGENPNKTDLVIFPNPTTGIIHLNELNTNADYRIYDVHGKIERMDKTENTVDISDLKRGVYFLEMVGNKSQMLRIIKQ